ncbi:hypothetical protein [Rhizobium leguminosarum]|uniref:hypothetical protein n=1 Tax=Rhizobium leguminosarum TaxID=384 RepID=UPI0010317613|nr:hypothetical protein [Rhizobium leguminosarum]TAX38967.1 hypothetical protein ELI05_08360 [Rhizobium leguminosarum]
MKKLLTLAIAITLVGGAAFAEDFTITSPPPAPLPQDRSSGFVIPTPGNGFIGGGSNSAGQGGIITHQPLGSGYSNSGAAFGDGRGNTFGGSITNGPSGPEGGTINFGTTF